MKPTIVAFELGHTLPVGLAGGDVLLEHLSPFLSDRFELHVVLPAMGAWHWRARPAHLHILPERDVILRSAFAIWRRYVQRVGRAIDLVTREVPNATLFYSSNDVWPDVRVPFILGQRGRRAPWVGRVHHLIPSPFKRRGTILRNVGSLLLQRQALRLLTEADLVIALNETLVPPLIRRGFRREQIRVLGAGIPLHRIERVTPHPNTPRFDAVFVGRLHRTKGIFDLPAIWLAVRTAVPSATLAVIGEGGERDRLVAAIRSAGLADSVRLLGFLPDEAKWRTLKGARLFLAPDHEAGFGVAAAEAMACGLPVVARDLPFYRSVFPRGLVTAPASDPTAFGQAVTELLRDEPRRNRLAANAKKLSESFNAPNVSATLARWFEELLPSPPHR